MNIFEKIKFLLQKPKVVIVVGEGRACATKAIQKVLGKYKNEILIFETDISLSEFNISKFRHIEFLIKNSSLPILVVTNLGDIPPEKDCNPPTIRGASTQVEEGGGRVGVPQAGPFFAGEKNEKIEELAKTIPTQGFLVLNFDDEAVRKIADIANLKTLTFGFQEGADFRVSDVKFNGRDASSSCQTREEPVLGTNFKINYKGNTVPVWLEKLFGKEQIYSALAAATVGVIFDLNLVEISQALNV